MSKTDLSGVWGFKGTSQLAKLTELQGYREKSKKNVKPPTPPCTEPLKRYVSSVLVQNLRRDGNIRLCPQHTQRRPSNSCERPRTSRSKFSPFWRNWVDSGVNRPKGLLPPPTKPQQQLRAAKWAARLLRMLVDCAVCASCAVATPGLRAPHMVKTNPVTQPS